MIAKLDLNRLIACITKFEHIPVDYFKSDWAANDIKLFPESMRDRLGDKEV